jgi:1-aminocyclopropane-1-carboxylate deaminase/D-cysteine desulfhydrase-like pyridoxal-dependent ACC family enzyme
LDFGDKVHYHTGNYPYHKPLNVDVGTVHLDEIYEAKAFDWMLKNLPHQGKQVCYWCIGDSNILRQ